MPPLVRGARCRLGASAAPWTLRSTCSPNWRGAEGVHHRAGYLRAEIVGERHACRIACRLRVRGHLDAQITHAGLGIRRQSVEDLLPTADEMQIGRVR